MSKRTIVAALRGGTLSAALIAGALSAPSAIAADSGETDIDNDSSVVSVGDVASGNAVNVCHNSVNALGVQATDIANGLAANLPILNDKPASTAEGGANCTASAVTVDKEGDDDHHNGGHHNGDDNGDHDNGGDNGGNGGNGDNGGGTDNGGNGANGGGYEPDEHAQDNGTAPQPVPAESHIAVTG